MAANCCRSPRRLSAAIASPIVFDENAKCERFLNELVYPAVHRGRRCARAKVFRAVPAGNQSYSADAHPRRDSERGKTQLANVIQAVVGRENCTQLRTKWLADRFETYRFTKKTLLVGVDVEPDFFSTKGAAVLKGLVGGDWFDAEQKGGTGSFPFQGNFCVIVTSNTQVACAVVRRRRRVATPVIDRSLRSATTEKEDP